MKPATKSDWKNKPLPAARAELTLNRSYSQAEMEKIRLGYVPEAMEDKWFIYWEDGCLYFHRSWTGICVYVVPIEAERDAFVTRSAEVNRLPGEYSATGDGHDAAMILYLVELLLLGRLEAEFPDIRRDQGDQGDGPEKALNTWHVVGRAMLGERPATKRSIGTGGMIRAGRWPVGSISPGWKVGAWRMS